MKVWLDGHLVDKQHATVPVYDHGLLYGDGVFEGIRVYNGRIFKLKSHLERLAASAHAIHLTLHYTIREIEQAVRETVVANGLKDAYIRLVVTRGAGPLGLNPFTCPKPATIIIVDRITLYPEEMYAEGMPVIVAKRPRVPVECLDPAVKSLNYLNNILAKVEAIEAGCHEAVMLNTDGEVCECTGDNIFLVRGSRIVTPPVSAGLLNGVTRLFVMNEVAPACGIDVAERTLRLDDLFTADEIFLTGTAAEVIGVRSVNGTAIGEGRVGPITGRLVSEFRSRVAREAPED
ncbi:MAG: branched-chain-amino-acid transaminase [Phycisphaera sp.]|nr:branched-chain-amino-acid transaminase [Phycisphaera sp.]